MTGWIAVMTILTVISLFIGYRKRNRMLRRFLNSRGWFKTTQLGKAHAFNAQLETLEGIVAALEPHGVTWQTASSGDIKLPLVLFINGKPFATAYESASDVLSIAPILADSAKLESTKDAQVVAPTGKKKSPFMNKSQWQNAKNGDYRWCNNRLEKRVNDTWVVDGTTPEKKQELGANGFPKSPKDGDRFNRNGTSLEYDANRDAWFPVK